MTPPAKKTIHFVSLGCPKNRVDTEVMLGVSDQAGYRLVPEASDADVIVVNTCGFVEAAKQESIDTIFELAQFKEQGRCEKLVVAGCLSQRYPQELANEMPEVDHFLGSSDMLKLGAVLKADAGEAPARVLVGNPADYVYKQSDPRVLSGARHSAYVKIAEGCSRKCSFCAIPSFRGTQRSRAPHDIVEEVQRLTDQGVVEINLVSQDTISYGRDLDKRSSLVELVQQLLEVRGLGWLRLFYLYPEKFDESLLELYAQGGKLVPYLDIPFQHASDAMLKRMRRGYNARRQRELLELVRSRVPQMFIRTAFIVGHPGETDQDFNELTDFIKFAELDHVGVFRYSHEDSTHSGSMSELVDEKTIEKRANALMRVQRGISKRRLRAMVGRELDVLVEGESDESELLLVGRHLGQAPEVDGRVHLINGSAQPGEIHRVRITHSADYDLVGDLSCGTDDPLRPDGPAKSKRAARKARLPVVSST
ncbi:MAG TPA: 30S ribosomal protein S12 methylthiotransferase RimO [Polyangiales bacterium]|nr:30S ribosomal protein S12 methylthiotransferase RimO [Polyangiales bacterium]